MQHVRTWLILATAVVVFAAQATAAKKTQVDFWWGEAAEMTTGAMRILVDEFNTFHPWVEVRLSEHGYLSSGSGLDKLKTAIAGGIPPDVVYIDAVYMLSQTFADNLYQPLDEVIDPAFLRSIPYLPAPKNYVTFGERHYGLQFRTDARGLYFNQDMFDEVGLNSQVGPRDIVELDQMAYKLTQMSAGGTIQRLGFAPRGNNFAGEMGWLWVFGGSIYNPATRMPTLTGNPAHLRALDWIASYATRYGPTASSGTSSFISRKVAMMVQSTTWLDKLPAQAPDLRWWVNYIPYPPEGRRTTLSSGMGVAIPRGAAKPEAAAEFIKYLAKSETQLRWYRLTREIPARMDAIQTLLRGREVTDPRERTMLELLPVAEAYPPMFSNTVLSEFTKNLDRMRRGEITPQQALEDTQRAVEPHFRSLQGVS